MNPGLPAPESELFTLATYCMTVNSLDKEVVEQHVQTSELQKKTECSQAGVVELKPMGAWMEPSWGCCRVQALRVRAGDRPGCSPPRVGLLHDLGLCEEAVQGVRHACVSL